MWTRLSKEEGVISAEVMVRGGHARQRPRRRLRHDSDVGALRPDLRSLLALPAERDNVVARRDLRHADLVNDGPLEELAGHLVGGAVAAVGAVVPPQLPEPVAVGGVDDLVAPPARSDTEAAEEVPRPRQVGARWWELVRGCLRRVRGAGVAADVERTAEPVAAGGIGFRVHVDPAGTVPVLIRIAGIAVRFVRSQEPSAPYAFCGGHCAGVAVCGQTGFRGVPATVQY